MSDVPQIPEMSEPPSKLDDGITYTKKADDFVADFIPFREGANAVAVFVNTKAGEADGSAQAASQSASQAAQSVTAAADAVRAAEGAARTYDNVGDGLAATGEGEYFTVPSSANTGYLDLYKNDASSAVLIRTSASDQVATDAEAARDAAQLAEAQAQASLSAVQDTANFYADTSAGIAATVDGDHFRVMASGNTAANLYRNDAGTATLLGTFPTEAGLLAWEQALRQNIIDLVKVPDEIPVKTVFFLGEAGSFIDVSSEGV